MRLLELEIKNVRGIPSLHLKPKGKNLVIWGPNGAGKSGVVDAIDFLLTGRIARLTGQGTKNISLSKHGPHIDHEPEDASVRAIVKLEDLEKPIEITRCLAEPNLVVCAEDARPFLEPIFALSGRGQHVLTRREILRFVTAEPAIRAQGIQELLKITDIDEIRKALVKAKNDLGRDCKTAQELTQTAQTSIRGNLQLAVFNPNEILKFVNDNRAILGATGIDVLQAEAIMKDVAPPASLGQKPEVNTTQCEQDIANIVLAITEDDAVRAGAKQLKELLEQIHSDPKHLLDLERLQLTELGLKLINETGSCPLCDTQWPKEKLNEYLSARLEAAHAVRSQKQQVEELALKISVKAKALTDILQRVAPILRKVDLADEANLFQEWIGKLQQLGPALTDPIDKYLESNCTPEQASRMFSPADAKEALARANEIIKAKFPKTSPEQNAWEQLNRLRESLRTYEEAVRRVRQLEKLTLKAKILHDTFLSARDNILGDLYESIRARFTSLYRSIHALDEGEFEANLVPEAAGLNFEVDFYGRGTHPPHALHSEGHQDSMGLCLYLALSEKLTAGIIDLTILDDVVMSVDSEHRRELCRVLAESFSDRQFLITTHDKTWAGQLKSEGIVEPGNIAEFYKWNLDTGPQVSIQSDIWERVEQDLSKGDVDTAAGRLRRAGEQFFGMVCDALGAPVVYKLNGKWDLGDFIFPAMGTYRDLIKKAKKAAVSWADAEQASLLDEHESVRSEVFKRTYAEQWAINVNVHYDNWHTFNEHDFRPVVEAFQDLFGLFMCVKCGSLLRLATVDGKRTSLLCKCGKVNWNLVSKE